MALYEYFCENCQAQFEQITSSGDPDAGRCPKCQKNNTRKLISAFKVGGRGDLRESTMHGCHDCDVPLGPGQSGGTAGAHDHSDHGHNHGESHEHSHSHGDRHNQGHGGHTEE